MIKCGDIIIKFFIAILFIAVFFLFQNPNASAITSTITLNITDSISVNVLPSDNGTFASSTATNNVSVKTDSASGYELGIKAGTSGSNNNALINTTDSSKTIPSITTTISEATYSSSSTYNNTWGLKPSKLNSQSNSNFIPGPTSATTSTVLDKTTTANPSTFNNYTITLGTRIDNTQAPGSYVNTFVITAVANPTPYTTTYNKNTTDTVTNMPDNVSSDTFSDQVTISNQVPAREGFNFKGWCTVQVADGGTCSGTTYNPDGGGTALTWTLNQTVSSNSLNLYAMWASAGPVITNTTCSTQVPSGITYMQELADSAKKSAALSSMTQGSQYYLVDERDNQGYCASKQADGHIWMTQNLDLDIGGSGVATLTSENTDLNTSGSAPYVDGYSTSDGVITWAPASTAYPSGRVINGTSVTGWSDNNSAPYSAEGGDRYYFTSGTTSNETAQTLAQCAAVSGRSKELCAHYHVGNYYNWNTAIASNNSGSYSPAQFIVASNSICPKGWKIPQGRTSSADASTWQFANLWWRGGAIKSLETRTFSNEGYTTDGFNIIRTSPLFFVRAGDISGNVLNSGGSSANYWTSTVFGNNYSYFTGFGGGHVLPAEGAAYQRSDGQTIRCMVR